jgi:hypothetical protein
MSAMRECPVFCERVQSGHWMEISGAKISRDAEKANRRQKQPAVLLVCHGAFDPPIR